MANSPITAPTFIQINATSVQTLGAAVKQLLFPLKSCLQALCLRASKTVTTDGLGTMDAPLVLESHATSGEPAAASWPAGIFYDSTLGVPVFSDGSTWFPIGSGGLIGVQVFSTAGTATYTPTAGTKSVVVELLGAGGGGGGCALTGAAQVAVGASGGSGGYALKRITSSFSGVTVTVGAKGTGGTAGANNGTSGGTTSFGAIFSATGGTFGTGGTAAAVPYILPTGGSSGAGSGGDINVNGAPGTVLAIPVTVTTIAWNAAGPAAAMYSGMTGVVTSNTGSAGTSASSTRRGSAGNGGLNSASQGTGKAGGDGADGLAIVWEYA